MIKDFEKLTTEEEHFMLQVPVMITILVAGADDDIDPKETAAAAKMIKLRSEIGDEELHAYYHDVNDGFNTMLDLLREKYPRFAESRNPIIAKQLEQLNDILPKLDHDFAASLYKSIRSFAKRIAESGGGVLGFAAVSKEEKKWMDLDMIRDPSAE